MKDYVRLEKVYISWGGVQYSVVKMTHCKSPKGKRERARIIKENKAKGKKEEIGKGRGGGAQRKYTSKRHKEERLQHLNLLKQLNLLMNRQTMSTLKTQI